MPKAKSRNKALPKRVRALAEPIDRAPINPAFVIDNAFVRQLHHRLVTKGPSYFLQAGEKVDEYIPSPAELSAMISGVFWSSLIPEEGRLSPVSAIFQPGGRAPGVAAEFATHLEFTPEVLAKLAPALARNTAIDVTSHEEKLLINGFWFSRTANHPFLVVAAAGPGNVRVSMSGVTYGLITGSRAVFIDSNQLEPVAKEFGLSQETRPRLGALARWRIVIDVAKRMEIARRGGALLLVRDDAWKQVVRQPIPYGTKTEVEVGSLTVGLSRLDATDRTPLDHGQWYEADHGIQVEIEHRDAELDALAHFTMIDGVTIVDYATFRVLAFGAKLKPNRVEDAPPVALIGEPLDGKAAWKEGSISSLGGMRHQSVAQFVYDVKNAIGIIASEDGRLSFMWWHREGKVAVLKHAELAFS